MSEKQLSEKQKRKIDELIKQWEKDIEDQVETLPPSDGRRLDGPRTWKRVELERKYRAMIQSVVDEE